ncbi:MAG: hypothetical protein IT430_03965 [Phycisphaerales bacterium]|nr:hypothetical protein [Phycisphaerales bacterium]
MTDENASREITLHHVGDSRVDRLRIFAMGEDPKQHFYAIVNPEADETLELIGFQSGPVCEVGVNGITNEALLAIVIDRLEGFQRGPMACFENREVLFHARRALTALHDRTRRRLAAGVEGRGKP